MEAHIGTLPRLPQTRILELLSGVDCREESAIERNSSSSTSFETPGPPSVNFPTSLEACKKCSKTWILNPKPYILWIASRSGTGKVTLLCSTLPEAFPQRYSFSAESMLSILSSESVRFVGGCSEERKPRSSRYYFSLLIGMMFCNFSDQESRTCA